MASTNSKDGILNTEELSVKNNSNNTNTKRCDTINSRIEMVGPSRDATFNPLLHNSNSNHVGNKRGDPRMNRAVAAKLANPSLSLLQALVIGGLKFQDCTETRSDGSKAVDANADGKCKKNTKSD